MTARSNRTGGLWAWLAPLAAPERRIDLVGAVTLLTLLLTAESTWVLRVGAATLAVAAIADRRLLRSSAYWFAMLAVYVVGVSGVALTMDNHEWLIGYWLLALALSRLVADPERGLAESARWLVGFAFAFATVWKLATPEYVRGDTFHALVLFDTRFVGVSSAFGGLPLREALENYETFKAVSAIGDAAVTVPIFDTPGVRRIALGMTWWTVAIEGVVAACFLAPAASWLGRARHLTLLAFLFTTYVLAPVTGFGWTLVAMGLAQAPLGRRRWLLVAYAAAFVLVVTRGAAPVDRLLSYF